MFRSKDAITSGLLTRSQLRSAAWRPLLCGVHADATLDVDHGLLSTAAGLVIPTGAAVTGVSAAWSYGVEVAGPDQPVDVVVPREQRFGPVAGLRVRSADLPPADVVRCAIPVTTPLRMAWDIASGPDLVEAVVGVDAVLAAGVVRAEALAADFALRGAGLDPRGRGRAARRAARALTLADARAESPQESRLRVRLVLAGLPPPVPQHVVRVGGRFVARVDLAWPAQQVAVEYDGAWHGEPGQLERDRERLNRLVGAGWTVLHVTARRLAAEPGSVVADVRAALERRGPALPTAAM